MKLVLLDQKCPYTVIARLEVFLHPSLLLSQATGRRERKMRRIPGCRFGVGGSAATLKSTVPPAAAT